uniref:Uncharacterized protein n=1 Tax=Arundo donax TaxID=35708 RepID=A0A0A9CD88_ARUDO
MPPFRQMDNTSNCQ